MTKTKYIDNSVLQFFYNNLHFGYTTIMHSAELMGEKSILRLLSQICFVSVHAPTAEISTVLCDKQNKAEMLLQNRENGETPVLKTIVIMDSFDPELVDRGAKCDVDILSWEAVEVRGKMEPVNIKAIFHLMEGLIYSQHAIMCHVVSILFSQSLFI